MSCRGQSAAAHSVSTPIANHTVWRTVTIGEPSRTTFGPITRTAYTAITTMETTSTHTSGCAWNCQGRIRSRVDEDVERRQHDRVDGDGEDDSGQEDAPEQLVVEAQVHEERGHDPELHDHQRHERDDQEDEVLFERVDVVRGHLDGGETRQDGGDDDVLGVAGM